MCHVIVYLAGSNVTYLFCLCFVEKTIREHLQADQVRHMFCYNSEINGFSALDTSN